MFILSVSVWMLILIFLMLYVYWGASIYKYFFFKKNKKISFECGFLPLSFSRTPFSVRFFLLLMMFVVFDVEMALILHFPFWLKILFLSRSLFLFFFFVLMLLMLEEWRRGALSWQ